MPNVKKINFKEYTKKRSRLLKQLDKIKTDAKQSPQILLLKLSRIKPLHKDFRDALTLEGVETRHDAVVSTALKLADALDMNPDTFYAERANAYHQRIDSLCYDLKPREYFLQFAPFKHLTMKTALKVFTNVHKDVKYF